MFFIQSGTWILKGGYLQTIEDVFSKTDRLDAALALVEAVLASGESLNTESGPWRQVGESLGVCAASKRDKNLFNALLKAEVNLMNLKFDAVMKGDQDMIKFILDSGSDVQERNGRDETLLHCAALMGHVEVMKTLLDSGANVNAEIHSRRDRTSYTPLHYAVRGGEPNVVKLLLEAGADVDAHVEGITASNLAALNGNVELLNLLLRQAGRVFDGVISEELYDRGWMDRYQRVWGPAQSLFQYPSRWELFSLPLPFKRTGDDWTAIFNSKYMSRNPDVSLLRSFRVGDSVSSICFNKDGAYIAAGTRKGVKIFETQSGKQVGSLIDDSPEAEEINQRPHLFEHICFVPGDGNDIITAGDSGVIRLWEISSQRVLRQFVGHESSISSLDVPRVGPSYLFASSGSRGSTKLWDMRSTQALLTLTDDSFATVAMSPNGNVVATAARCQSYVSFWNTNGVWLQNLEVVDSDYISFENIVLAFSPNGKELITSSRECTKVWRISKGIKPIKQGWRHGDPCKFTFRRISALSPVGVSYSSNGSVFAIAYNDSAKTLFWGGQNERASPLCCLDFDGLRYLPSL